MKVEILGTGCAKCEQLYSKILKLTNTDSGFEIVKVSDLAAISRYGVMSTPAIVIDGEVKTSGRMPSDDELRELLGIGSPASGDIHF